MGSTSCLSINREESLIKGHDFFISFRTVVTERTSNTSSKFFSYSIKNYFLKIINFNYFNFNNNNTLFYCTLPNITDFLKYIIYECLLIPWGLISHIRSS